MKKVVFLRHGATAGNLERRYIGRTDEPLCARGRAQAVAARGLTADRIFTSPARRTKETAELAFPGRSYTVIEDLWETDFGIFEGRTADELREEPRYAAWLDTLCQAPCPGGEGIDGFRERCCRGFLSAIGEVMDGQTAVFVIHGGCIMAILERFGLPKKEFYSWYIGNGQSIGCRWDGIHLFTEESMLL